MGVSGCSEAPQQEVTSTTLPQGDPIQGEPIETTPTPPLEGELTDSPETNLANQATEDMAVPADLNHFRHRNSLPCWMALLLDALF